MEIFSTDTRDGKIYEGTVRADGFGNFSFSKDTALSGPFLTATSRSSGDNTSELSPPTAIHTDIQIALDTIENEAPLYQTSFGSWDSDEPEGNANAWIENGKLLIASFNHEYASVEIHSISSDRFAVEFELTILEASPEGHCVSGTSDDEIGESWRGLSFGFFSNGQLGLGHVVAPDITESLAMSRFGETKSNTVTAIIPGDHIAAFINGQLAYTAFDPDGSALTYQDLAATYTIVCEYDNYKVWDLS